MQIVYLVVKMCQPQLWVGGITTSTADSKWFTVEEAYVIYFVGRLKNLITFTSGIFEGIDFWVFTTIFVIKTRMLLGLYEIKL